MIIRLNGKISDKITKNKLFTTQKKKHYPLLVHKKENLAGNKKTLSKQDI